MKIFGTIITVIVGICLLIGVGIIFKVVFFPVKVIQNEIQTGYDTVDKTINADNAIYNYEWFKQTYEDINALKNQLDNASSLADSFKAEAGDRSKWTFEDKQESARLDSIKLGLQNRVEQVVANYNARAKMANRNIFQNSILPNFIDSLTFITK
jgi:hypothetical protein